MTESKSGRAGPPALPETISGPAEVGSGKRKLATTSPMYMFEYEDIRITYSGTEVPADKLGALRDAARMQNVELREVD